MIKNVYLLGGDTHAFICGVNTCPINGETLPFFGVCDNTKVFEALGPNNKTRLFEEQEDIEKMVGIYRENGTLSFFQHLGAAQYAMQSLMMTFSSLAEQGWTGQSTPTVN